MTLIGMRLQSGFGRPSTFRRAQLGKLLAAFVGLIILCVVNPRLPRVRSSSNVALTAALWGAVIAFAGNAVVAVIANIYTRHDQHVQEADRCNGLTGSLISMADFASATAKAAAAALTPPFPANLDHVRFELPPIDEVIHSQEQFLDIVDPDSRKIILKLDLYYRIIRDDLSHTNGVKAEGESFEIPTTSPNREFYEKILNQIGHLGDVASDSLNKSLHCNELAQMDWFWSHVRPRPVASSSSSF